MTAATTTVPAEVAAAARAYVQQIHDGEGVKALAAWAAFVDGVTLAIQDAISANTPAGCEANPHVGYLATAADLLANLRKEADRRGLYLDPANYDDYAAGRKAARVLVGA